MFCLKCGRLNPQETQVCRFCGFDFINEQDTGEEAILPDPIIQKYSYTVKEKKGEYFKYGWLLVAAAVAALAVALCLILSCISYPAEKAVKSYVAAYYESSFDETMQSSAIDLQKHYYLSTQSSLNNFFGFFSQYNSFEQMYASYSADFQNRKAVLMNAYGNDFDVKVHILDDEKLTDNASAQIYQSYYVTFNDILRDGEKSNIYLVRAEIAIESDKKSIKETYAFLVAEIAGECYVLTNTDYEPWRIYE